MNPFYTTYEYIPFDKIAETDFEPAMLKGIEEEEQKMIFTRFYKQDEFAQGAGLGLSLCKHFVEKMGGDIELASEKNKGSRFSVVLPLK